MNIIIFDKIFVFPRNLQAFNAAVLANVPLFQIEAILSAPELMLQPNASEIAEMTAQCILDCIEITKVIFDKDLLVARVCM